METKLKIPNTVLRYQREVRGWSQKRVAEVLIAVATKGSPVILDTCFLPMREAQEYPQAE